MYFRLIQMYRGESDEAETRGREICAVMRGEELGQGQWARLRDES